MFSQCLAASDLNLHTHLSSWICGKTASPSKKCATLFFSSSAIQVETDELPVAQQLSEISKISNFLIYSGAMCNISSTADCLFLLSMEKGLCMGVI